MSNETTAIAERINMLPQSAEAQAFELLQRQGKMLSQSNIVPENYRGKVADCALIFEIAHRMKASPVLVANNLDIIHGRPSWRAQFLIACVNQSGKFSALRYEYEGEGKTRKCRAWARELASGDRLDGTWISWDMAEKEGWTKKAGSKWHSMTEQMLAYRAAAFWTRMYAPEIALGFPTDDEVRDVIDVTPTRPAGADVLRSLNEAITGQATQQSQPPAGTVEGSGDMFLTTEDVMTAIERAKNVDDLEAAAALIDGLADPVSRETLRGSYHERREQLGAAA